jgi:hypothetical protein
MIRQNEQQIVEMRPQNHLFGSALVETETEKVRSLLCKEKEQVRCLLCKLSRCELCKMGHDTAEYG